MADIEAQVAVVRLPSPCPTVRLLHRLIQRLQDSDETDSAFGDDSAS